MGVILASADPIKCMGQVPQLPKLKVQRWQISNVKKQLMRSLMDFTKSCKCYNNKNSIYNDGIDDNTYV